MSKTEINIPVENILSSARKYQLYMGELDQLDFNYDVKTQDSVLMNLIVIGEQVTKVIAYHPEFVEANKGIPWQQIKGSRNRVAHGYFDVDLGLIWNTVQNHLPHLIEMLENPHYPAPTNDSPEP